jgi:hypothetical protein
VQERLGKRIWVCGSEAGAGFLRRDERAGSEAAFELARSHQTVDRAPAC